jgi:hypothetical protein
MLRDVAHLSQLEHLDIRKTTITDSGLVHLSNLRQLRVLDAHDTFVTPDGAATLEQALPGCRVWVADRENELR